MMRVGVRQQMTGIVVNQHPNIARPEFDRIKAELSNCVRHGAASQNRAGRANYQAYLAGRVAHVCMISPGRGAKLRGLFNAIEWFDRGEKPDGLAAMAAVNA